MAKGTEWFYGKGDSSIWEEALATMDKDEFGIRWLQNARRAIGRGETMEWVIWFFGPPPEAARRALDL